MKTVETPDKITPRTLIKNFTTQQETTQPITRGRKHVERTPDDNSTVKERSPSTSKPRASVRRSPRGSQMEENVNSGKLREVRLTYSAQSKKEHKKMESPDEITPRTMIKHFTDQQKTTQPINRKRKHDEKTPHEKSPGKRNRSPSKPHEPAGKKQRSSLMKKAVINSINVKGTPRSIIQQFVEEVSEETPVKPPLRRSVRLLDENSSFDASVPSIKRPTPIVINKLVKTKDGQKSKIERTLRNYSFTSHHQKESTTDTAVQAETSALSATLGRIGDESLKEMGIPLPSLEVIPSSRSPSPIHEDYRSSLVANVMFSPTHSNDVQSESELVHQLSVGRSAFSHRNTEKLVSISGQQNVSQRRINPSDSLSDSDVYSQSISYSASDEASPMKPASADMGKKKLNLQTSRHEVKPHAVFSDQESVDEHSSQLEAILNTLGSSRGGSSVHSIRSEPQENLSSPASKLYSPNKSPSRHLRKNQDSQSTDIGKRISPSHSVDSHVNVSSKQSAHIRRKSGSVIGSEKSFNSKRSLSPASSARIELRRKSKALEETQLALLDRIGASAEGIDREKSLCVDQGVSQKGSQIEQPTSALETKNDSAVSSEGKLRLSPTLSSKSSQRRAVSAASLHSSFHEIEHSTTSTQNALRSPGQINDLHGSASPPSSTSLRRRYSRPNDGPPLFLDGETKTSLKDKRQTSSPQTCSSSKDARTDTSVTKDKVITGSTGSVHSLSVTNKLEVSPSLSLSKRRHLSREVPSDAGGLEAPSPRSLRNILRRKSRLNDEVNTSISSGLESSPQSIRSIQRRKSRLNDETTTSVAGGLESSSPQSVRSIQRRKSCLNDETNSSVAGRLELSSPTSVRSIQRRNSRLNVETNTSVTGGVESSSPTSVRSIQRRKSHLNNEASTLNESRKGIFSEQIHTVTGRPETASSQSVGNIQRKSSRLNDEPVISGHGESPPSISVCISERGVTSYEHDNLGPSTDPRSAIASSPYTRRSSQRQKSEQNESYSEHRSPDETKSRPSRSVTYSDRTLRKRDVSGNVSKSATHISPDKDSQHHSGITSPSISDTDSKKDDSKFRGQHHGKNVSKRAHLSARQDQSHLSVSDALEVRPSPSQHSSLKFTTSTPHVSRSLSLENQFSGEMSLSRITEPSPAKPSTSMAGNDSDTRHEESTAITDDRDEEDTLHVEQEPVVSKKLTQKADNLKKSRKKVQKEQRKCCIPRKNVKSVFNHFAKSRVSRDAWDAIESASDKFFKHLVRDLEAYTVHGHRKSINEEDVELLMRRQGFVTDKQSVYTLVEKYLPLEDRREIIPMARSGNKILP